MAIFVPRLYRIKIVSYICMFLIIDCVLDIFHFGWNIWNYFRIGKQGDIALFLKLIFAHILRDVEAETVKKHLKDDENKGIIKIRETII